MRPVVPGVLVLALAAGCSDSVRHDKIDAIKGLTVSGKVGVAPVVRMAPPLRVSGTASETVVEGTGPQLGPDQEFLAQETAYDGRTGQKLMSTYDAGKLPEVITSGSVAPELARALVGRRQGSRVVVVQRNGSSVSVLITDILAVPPAQTIARASGTPKEPAAGMPRVVLRAGVPTGLDFTGVTRPATPMVATLISGDGPPVRKDSLVTVRTLGQIWGRRVPFDDSFAKDPILVPAGIGGASWQDTLVGVRRGSRLLVVTPPAGGRSATICYVIDVLGVS